MSPRKLFLVFTYLSMMGFGGVLPWAYRVLVEQRQVVSPEDFREQFAYAQLFPGPTICNLAVLVGYREAGLRGGTAALSGMLAFPCLTVCAIWWALQRVGNTALVVAVLHGMSAVAAGLVTATAIKLARTLEPHWRNLLVAGLMVAGLALLRAPLLLLIAVLVPFSLWLMRGRDQRDGAQEPPHG